jgi:hypothetical protein
MDVVDIWDGGRYADGVIDASGQLVFRMPGVVAKQHSSGYPTVLSMVSYAVSD